MIENASLRGFTAPTDEMRQAISELGWCMSLFGVLEYLSIVWLHELKLSQAEMAVEENSAARIERLIASIKRSALSYDLKREAIEEWQAAKIDFKLLGQVAQSPMLARVPPEKSRSARPIIGVLDKQALKRSPSSSPEFLPVPELAKLHRLLEERAARLERLRQAAFPAELTASA